MPPLDLDALRQKLQTRWNGPGTFDEVCAVLDELAEARRTLQTIRVVARSGGRSYEMKMDEIHDALDELDKAAPPED